MTAQDADALIAAPAAADDETLYTVKAGDTLGAITKATYGDLMKYKAIFERNADRLRERQHHLRGTGHRPAREVNAICQSKKYPPRFFGVGIFVRIVFA